MADMRTDRAGRPILDQFSADGFVDLTFRIDDLTEDDEHYRFHLSASHKRREVGLDVELLKGIKAGFNAKMGLVKKHVYREGVRFLRSGPESDRLIEAIGQLYGVKKAPQRMVRQETCTAIALHHGKLDFEREAVKLKLFGCDEEPLDEDAYYESFFNVDLPEGLVYWNEKDAEYRQPLLRAFSIRARS